MAALAVVATLVLVAVPSVNGFMLDNRRAATANDLIGTLNFGRMQAIVLRAPITVCRSLNPQSSAPDCAGSGGWESGWIAFVDTDGDGVRDDGEAVLRQHEALASGATLRGNSKVSTRVTFRPSGITGNNGSIALCDQRGWGSASRVIVIATSGRVRSTSPDAGDENPLNSCMPTG